MEDAEATVPQNERPTDPSELKPSLPPNAVTFADILASHHAILGELQAMRIDFINFKAQILEQPSWVTEFLDSAMGLVTRVEQLEQSLAKQERYCHFQHGNGRA